MSSKDEKRQIPSNIIVCQRREIFNTWQLYAKEGNSAIFQKLCQFKFYELLQVCLFIAAHADLIVWSLSQITVTFDHNFFLLKHISDQKCGILIIPVVEMRKSIVKKLKLKIISFQIFKH